jgi:uncharacterized membrane protein
MVIGIPLMVLVGLWIFYRIVRGWLALTGRKTMPMPG